MNSLIPSWTMETPCGESARWLHKALKTAGLEPVQTFDLRNARLAAIGCACPHHGTEACDCQMVVLLVYSRNRSPVTLVIHGNDRQSWISVTDRPDQRADAQTVLEIQRVLQSSAMT